MRRLEPAFALRHAEGGESLDRLGEALDRIFAEIAQSEAVAYEPPRRC
jgi:hypothetical protein